MKISMPVVVAIAALFLLGSIPKMLLLFFPSSKAAAMFSAKEAFRIFWLGVGVTSILLSVPFLSSIGIHRNTYRVTGVFVLFIGIFLLFTLLV